MISSDIALIGTTIHRVAQLIQQRIDNEIGDSGLTRLSWMAAAHVEDSPGLTIGDLAGRLEVGRAGETNAQFNLTQTSGVQMQKNGGPRVRTYGYCLGSH